MLSVGVTANRLSVTPAANPAAAARGPDTLPSASASNLLYWSKATNPIVRHQPRMFSLLPFQAHMNVPVDRDTAKGDVRIPALAELPMMSVVHPAYHCGPNGGHGSFLPSASRRLSCVLVLATVASSGGSVSSASHS